MKLSDYIQQQDASNLANSAQIENQNTFSLSEYLKTTDPVVARRNFADNMVESFKRGTSHAQMSQAKFMAKHGIITPDELKPLIARQEEILSSDPIKSEGIIRDALYSVSQMLPAMAQGSIEGGTVGLATATGAGIVNPLLVPAGFLGGSIAGSFNYWRRQGEGDLWWDLKEANIPDNIADPVSVVGGAVYGAIEFSQVLKLSPVGGDVVKNFFKESLTKSLQKFAKKWGKDYLTELGEEGLQEVVIESSKETAEYIAGTQDESMGEVVQKIIMAGYEAIKESALPMLFLMGPRAGVGTYQLAKENKVISEANRLKAKQVLEESKEKEYPMIVFDSEMSDQAWSELVARAKEAKAQKSPDVSTPGADTAIAGKPPATPLHAEALKYKTAEEFVDSYKLFRRTDNDEGKPFNMVNYALFSDDKDRISHYGKNLFVVDKENIKLASPEEVKEVFYKKLLQNEDILDTYRQEKIDDEGDMVLESFEETARGISEGIDTGDIVSSAGIFDNTELFDIFYDSIEEKGFDGIKTSDGAVIFNEEKIKSEKQLTAIYNEAHKVVEGDTMAGENAEGKFFWQELGIDIGPKDVEVKDKRSSLETKLESLKERQDRLDFAKASLVGIDEMRKEFKASIKNYKKGNLKEELRSIPRYYKTSNESAMSPDEVMQAFRDRYGIEFASETEMAQYLQNLDKQKARLKEYAKENQPKPITLKDITLIKKQMQSFYQGVRAGKVDAKKEIADIQTKLLDTIKSLDIEAKDKAKFLTSIKNANTPQSLEKQIDKVLFRASKYAQDTEKRAAIKKINKELKYTKPVKSGAKTVGKYAYEDNKLFEELRQANAMNQDQAIKELDSMPTEGLTELELIKARLLSYKANGMKSSVSLINQVLADIESLKYAGELSKNEEDFLKSIERKSAVKEVLSGIEKIKGDKDSIITKVENVYRQGFTNIYSMINAISGKEMAEKLDPLTKENDVAISVNRTTKEMAKDASKIYGLSNRDEILGVLEDMAREKYILTDVDGLRHEITKLEIIDIYNSLENETTKERYYNAFGEGQITEAINNLNEKDVSFAKFLRERVDSEEYFDILNQRNIELTGRDLGQVEGYWPATSERAPDIFDDIKVQSNIPSAMKERAKSNKIIPVPSNAWYKAMRHISQAEHVRHLSREYEGLKRTFSDRAVKNAIKNKFGDGVYNTLMDQIENISLNRTTAKIDAVSNVIGKAINNWVVAKIAVNPGVFAKQLVSFINFAENMPTGKWAAGFFSGMTDPQATFKYMWDNAPFLEERFNKGYSEAIKEAVRGAEMIGKNKYQWTKGLTALVRAGDVTAIIYGGYPYVKYLEPIVGKEKAFEMFRKQTLKSQQAGERSSLSQFQNWNHPISRLFLAFKNTANQYLRKQADAIISYRNGDISKEQLVKTTIIYSVLNPIMYSYMGIALSSGTKAVGEALFGTYNDDDRDAESTLMELLVQILINPFIAVPILDDISQFAVKNMVGQSTYKMFNTPLFDDIENAGRRLTKEDITLMDYLSSFGVVAEATTGAPVGTVLRVYKNLFGDE
jgi:hypothetical protein